MDFSSVIKLHINKSSSMSQLFLQASEYYMLHGRDMTQAHIYKTAVRPTNLTKFQVCISCNVCTFLPAFIIILTNHWITTSTSRYSAHLHSSEYTDIILSDNTHYSSLRLFCMMVGSAVLTLFQFPVRWGPIYRVFHDFRA